MRSPQFPRGPLALASCRSPQMLVLAAVTLLLLAPPRCLALGKGEATEWVARRLGEQGRSYLALPLDSLDEYSTRRRKLEEDSMMKLGGGMALGYHWVNIELGSPPTTHHLITDTGSLMTFVPCADCPGCGPHMNPRYDPSASNSSVQQTCPSSCTCSNCACNIGPAFWQRGCSYGIAFAEGSSSSGSVYRDLVRMEGTTRGMSVVFGCSMEETGYIYDDKADGIMGLGNHETSFAGQLAAQGLIDPIFSLCHGFPKGGALFLGDAPLPPGTSDMIYSPLLNPEEDHFYLSLTGLKFGDSQVLEGQQYPLRTGVDTGLTFTKLVPELFDELKGSLEEHLKQQNGIKKVRGVRGPVDTCWGGAPHSFFQLGSIFPNITLQFDGDTELVLTPMRYLFTQRDGEYCLSIFSAYMDFNRIGAMNMRNVMLQFDRRNKRIGFMETSCNMVQMDDGEWELEYDNPPGVEQSSPPPSPPLSPVPHPPPLPPTPSPTPLPFPPPPPPSPPPPPPSYGGSFYPPSAKPPVDPPTYAYPPENHQPPEEYTEPPMRAPSPRKKNPPGDPPSPEKKNARPPPNPRKKKV